MARRRTPRRADRFVLSRARYRGQFDFASFTTQVHDFNPGISPYPSGLVWTLPMSAPDATCAFDIRWDARVTTRGTVQTLATNGELLQCQATMARSAANAQGFRFQSDPQPTTSVFAQLGRIRNGVFANR